MDGRRRGRLARTVAEHITASGRAELGRALCGVCLRVLPDVEATALVLHGSSRAEELVGASDPWAAGLEEMQYTLGEGPGVDVISSSGPLFVPDLSVDEVRWPLFAAAGRAQGLAAMFVFPLQIGAIRLGRLSLYRRRIGGLSGDAIGDAALLADLAAHVLLGQNERMGEEERMRMEVSYQDVNMATGMLAAQLRIGLEEAFLRLRAHAYSSDKSVLDVARDVLARRMSLDQLTD